MATHRTNYWVDLYIRLLQRADTPKRSLLCIVAVLILIVSVAANVQAQEETSNEAADAALLKDLNEATLFPIPDHSADLFSRTSFTGDWGGARTRIAKENGIQFAVDVNQYYQGVTSEFLSRLTAPGPLSTISISNFIPYATGVCLDASASPIKIQV